MDSPTALSRYILQNSKKRVFLGGSSSSGRADVEVLEVSPPTTRFSKPKSSKQKEVISHEIIDVDMEEDCDDEALIMELKGKKVSTSPSLGVSSLPKEEFGNDILTSNDGAAVLGDSANVDDFNSNNFLYGEDEWIESYYDDIIYDDNPNLESHFDHMDIPPGVEAQFPWFPSSPRNDTKVPTQSTSAYSVTPLQSDGDTISPGLSSSPGLSASPQHAVIMDMDEHSSWNQMSVANKLSKKEKLLSKMMESSQKMSSSYAYLNLHHSSGSLAQKYGKEPWRTHGKIKRKAHSPHVSMFANQYSHHYPPPPPVFPFSGGGSQPCPIMPPALGAGNSIPVWQDMPLDMFESPGYMNGSSLPTWEQNLPNNVNGASPVGTSWPTNTGPINVEEILQKFESFKKFDTVEDHSDHHYSKHNSLEQPPKNWAKRIQEEWRILENDLPDEIFVRVYESRMDLLRAVIIGAEGTPYHDGLFFFDVFFPSNYPKVPPHVYYHSGGLRINPNLYNCGKVCLSLLNTWRGSGKEKWIPGVSTMLQVLVSIQGLILNARPYFNEPGYESTSGTRDGEMRSLEYNERTFLHNLRTMVYTMRRPPKYYEEYVHGYFCKHARDILVSCKAYMEGVQVGCLVKGGVQDVDESSKSCSQQFKNQLAGFITTLVNTFSGIGVKDCEEFLSLASAKKENGAPTPPASWNINLFS